MKNNYINTKMDKHIIILTKLLSNLFNKDKEHISWEDADDDLKARRMRYNIYDYLSGKKKGKSIWMGKAQK